MPERPSFKALAALEATLAEVVLSREVCDKALPAIDLAVLPEDGFFKTLEALDAIRSEVFSFLAMAVSSIIRNCGFFRGTYCKAMPNLWIGA